jgi:ribosomal protein S18 acetylase RimI-like enzyme
MWHEMAGRSPHEPVEPRAHDRSPSYVAELDLVAVQDGSLVGYCMGQVETTVNLRWGLRDGWTDPIGVRAAHRRRGLATALVTRCLHGLRQRSLTRALLGVRAENGPAMGLYHRLGYGELRRRANYRRTFDAGS